MRKKKYWNNLQTVQHVCHVAVSRLQCFFLVLCSGLEIFALSVDVGLRDESLKLINKAQQQIKQMQNQVQRWKTASVKLEVGGKQTKMPRKQSWWGMEKVEISTKKLFNFEKLLQIGKKVISYLKKKKYLKF